MQSTTLFITYGDTDTKKLQLEKQDASPYKNIKIVSVKTLKTHDGDAVLDFEGVGIGDDVLVWLRVNVLLAETDDDGESVADSEAVHVSLGVLRCDTEGERLTLWL
jgi:hypothetical protein